MKQHPILAQLSSNPQVSLPAQKNTVLIPSTRSSSDSISTNHHLSQFNCTQVINNPSLSGKNTTVISLALLLTTNTDIPTQNQSWKNWPSSKSIPSLPSEPNLKNIKQLTFGGQNAEAYWDKSGKKIVYQSRQPEFPDEQIFTMNANGSGKKLISTGLGRCTCSYFSPDGNWIYFSSTHDKDTGPQKPVDMSMGYVWMVNPNFGLWKVKTNGTDLQKVIDMPDYVAETTIAPSGAFMTFTGSWAGNVNIYRSDLNGFNIKPLVTEFGYNGGPFVSWDSKQIVYRRSAQFQSDEEKQEFKELLDHHLVRPSKMDIWMMDAYGNNKKQVTNLGAASFAPFIHPDGKRIVFSSNHHDPQRREFDLFIINTDGSGLKQITHSPEFDGFPMFSRDGKKLIWSSNRFGAVRGETNVFVADWKD